MTDNALTLDDLFADIKAQYASLDFRLEGGLLELRNPFALSGDERKELTSLQKSLRFKGQAPEVNDEQGEDESDEDFEARRDLEDEAQAAYSEATEAQAREAISKIIRLVSNDVTLANELLGRLGENTAGLMVLFKKYQEKVQAGEA